MAKAYDDGLETFDNALYVILNSFIPLSVFIQFHFPPFSATTW